MKNTKTKLISSVAVLLICFAMLIGSTFAWFTDSASTGVNKIQAGNLDVEIVKPDTNTKLTTLNWLKANGSPADEAVLWEPGVSYKLTTFEVKNVGDLALKFKMNISVGSETLGPNNKKLSDVIEWKIYTDENYNEPMSTNPYIAFNKESVYELGIGESQKFSILASMKTTADNDYQKLTMDSITVDVIAAQNTVENDSFGNQYDVTAQYPVVAVASVQVENNVVTSQVKVSTAEMIGTTPQATLTVPQGVEVDENTKSLDFSIDEVANNSNSGIEISKVNKTLEISVKGIAQGNIKPLTVEVYVGEGLDNLVLTHNGNSMNKKEHLNLVNEDQDYYYDSLTGFVTLMSSSFSPFEIEYDKNSYAISNVSDLLKFAELVNTGNNLFVGKTVTLESDLDLSDVEWTPIGLKDNGSFSGTFDGNNYTISNINCINPKYGGLFGFMGASATIKNLNLNNVQFTNGGNIDGECAGGSLIGWVEPHTSDNEEIIIAIENVSIEGIKADGYKYTGGLIGYQSGGGNISINMNSVSIVGTQSMNTINSSYNESGNYKGHVGGLIGFYQHGNASDIKLKDINITRSGESSNTGNNRAGAVVGTIYGPSTINVSLIENVNLLGETVTRTSNLAGPGASTGTVNWSE